jgi:UDP-N-acetylmuramate dehydrogenase
MKVGGPAEVLLKLSNLRELPAIRQFCYQEQIPFHILGGASNVLIDDAGLRGLVVINQCRQVWHWPTREEVYRAIPELAEGKIPVEASGQWLGAESGLQTALLVRAAVDVGLTGLEPFLGVPGTVGGAIVNNAHYTAELIGDYVWAVEVCDQTGQVTWLPAADCDFAYDASRFQRSEEIVMRVIFYLLPGDPLLSQTKMQTFATKRANTQPLGTANSGCMFKNLALTPEQATRFGGKTSLSVGWLIDQAGLKGTRMGGAEVSMKHGNFIVNTGGATSADIRQLVAHIQATVWDKFQLHLEPEVFFLGDENKGK